MSEGQDMRDPRHEEREPEGPRGTSAGAGEPAAGQKPADGPDSAESGDGREPAGGPDSAESGDGREPAGGPDSAESRDGRGPAERQEPEDGQESADRRELAASAAGREPADRQEPAESEDSRKSAAGRESADRRELAASAAGREPADGRDSAGRRDSAEARDGRESVDGPESAGGRVSDVVEDSGDAAGDGAGRAEAGEVPHVSGPAPGHGPARGPEHEGVPLADGLARLRALVTPPGQHPTHTHAGNGTVNDGRDEQSPEGLDSDELQLRALLHQAVQDVEPSDGTLDYLRRAVPARRARKRQALVGAAAAALFLGTAVPALVHVSGAVGSDANPSAVGHASQAQGGTGQGKDPGQGETTAGGASDEVEGDDEGGKKEGDKAGTDSGTGTGATEGTDPSADSTAAAPACTGGQLGPATATSAAPDSAGAVYGSFRVANVSEASCTVEGAGSVGAAPQGAADAAKIGTARHVAGDAAAGLPDPSLEAATLVLKPGDAYEVRFAWVPSETCPAPGDTTGGGTGGPTADPTPSENPTNTAGATTGTGSGTATQLLREDGGTEGSVTVTYTPVTGTGPATATVANACAGTVYWTGLLTPVG